MNKWVFLILMLVVAAAIVVFYDKLQAIWQSLTIVAAALLAPFKWLVDKFTGSEHKKIDDEIDSRIKEREEYLQKINGHIERYNMDIQRLNGEADRLRLSLDSLKKEEQTLRDRIAAISPEELLEDINERYGRQ